jgi:putative acetyltransferase
VTIRPEGPEDVAAIRAINQAAFGRPDEAALVDALRQEGAVLVSLVAEVDSQPAGHILFSRMFVEATPAVALAPMAVLPAHQNQGLGSALVRAGLDELRRMQERIVIVLGHPDYYPRFGFSPELARRLKHPFPPNALMALELAPGALDNVHGRLKYAKPFGI